MSEREALVASVLEHIKLIPDDCAEHILLRRCAVALTAQQEPVAWMWIDADGEKQLSPKSLAHMGMPNAIPLYTTPPSGVRDADGVVVPSVLWSKIKEVLARRFPRCRDCADENGVCPDSGLPCDMDAALLAAALAEKDDSGWMPIETAPKDGTKIKLLCEFGEDEGFYCDYTKRDWNPSGLPGEWSTDKGNGDPTHWRPLPRCRKEISNAQH